LSDTDPFWAPLAESFFVNTPPFVRQLLSEESLAIRSIAFRHWFPPVEAGVEDQRYVGQFGECLDNTVEAWVRGAIDGLDSGRTVNVPRAAAGPRRRTRLSTLLAFQKFEAVPLCYA
jgi:hypothetical protein